MKKYDIDFTPSFLKSYKRIIGKNPAMTKRIDKAVNLLSNDPYYSSLKTHKVTTRLHGERYSSTVTGDIRIIWDYNSDENIVLTLLDIGGHSGSQKVYQ